MEYTLQDKRIGRTRGSRSLLGIKNPPPENQSCVETSAIYRDQTASRLALQYLRLVVGEIP